jgi:hypothetical protein
VVPPEWFDENSKHGTNLCKEYQVGSFSVIIDESQQTDNEHTKKFGSNKPKGAIGSLWR